MRDQPNPNPSPRARMHAVKGAVNQHLDLIVRPDLRAALDVALLQYSHQLSQLREPNAAFAAHYRLSGAHEFVDLFLRLGEPPVSLESRSRTDNLDHSA